MAGYPFWSDKELDRLRLKSRALYVADFTSAVRQGFFEVEAECRDEVRELFEATNYLRDLGKDPQLFDQNRDLLKAARFVTVPVISSDTLKIVGETKGTVKTIKDSLDRDRFPWLAKRQTPRPKDPAVVAALAMTARLMAEQRRATGQRTTASQKQEAQVRTTLAGCKMTYVEPNEIRARIKGLGDMPQQGLTGTNYQEVLKRGEFTREIHVAGTKCDVPTRLKNGDLLPIECKVSNTEVNSVKRLNRETGGKHEKWRNAFGASLHTGAVLRGVFRLGNLTDAQDDGILIFFEHDLAALARFVGAGGKPRAKK